MQPLRLVIVDKQDLSRHGIQMLLSSCDFPLQVVGSYTDLSQAELFLEANRAHMLLLDDSLPRAVDLHQLLDRLRGDHPGLSIIILANRLNPRYVRRVFDSGARGLIYKLDRLEDTLVTGIKSVWDGNTYLSPRAMTLFCSNWQSSNPDQFNQSDLAVLQLMGEGFIPQEIALHLDLSVRSIYRIYGRLRQLLGVRTNEQLVDTARKRGLLDD
jgi:two-component system, NarL family, response regulator DesR